MNRESNVFYKYITDWANEPTVNELKQDLISSLGDHNDHVSKILRWRNLLNVEGSDKPRKRKGKSSVEPRLIRRQAEWRYSALTEPFLSSDKIFSVMPRTFEDTDSARQNEILLNYQFNTKINKVKFIDDLVRCTVNDGTAIVRLGWERKTKKEKRIDPVYTYQPIYDQMQLQQFQQQAEQLSQLEQMNPRGFDLTPKEIKAAYEAFKQTGQPCVAMPIGLQEIEEEKIVENRPTLEILNPENVYIDPTCNGDIDNALFVITSFETNRAFLQSTGLYKNLDKINWDESSTTLTDEYHTTDSDMSFNFKDSTRKKVIAYEYWGYYDINNDGSLQPIVATWIGDVMVRLELNPFPDQKLPFVVVQYLPIPRSVYGEPDAALLSENQKIYGAILRGIIDTLGNSANSQIGYAKGFVDPLNKQRIERGDNFEFDGNIPLQNGFIQLTYPEIPQTAMLMINLMNQDAEALTGVKSFAEGISGTTYGNLTAGVKSVLDASGKREMAILRRLSKAITFIGAKIVSMNYAFLGEKEIVRVTNEKFIEIDPEDLKGTYDIIIDINTAEVDSQKSQELSFLAQTIGPNLEQPMLFKIISKIADLNRLPDLAYDLRNYQPQPNPTQEALNQKLQSEVQKVQAETQKIQSEGQVNQIKAQTEQIKAQTEQAKMQSEQLQAQAQQAKIQADMLKAKTAAEVAQANIRDQQIRTAYDTSLEPHRRALELIKEQSAGNRELAVVTAMMKPTKSEEKKPSFDKALLYNESIDRKEI